MHDRKGTYGALDCADGLSVAADILDGRISDLEDTIADLERAGDDPETLAEQRSELDRLERALQTLRNILEQRGCDDYGNDCPDGKLTTLMDTVIFG